VQVWSKRGSVKAKAVVTKRINTLICDGKPVHVIGVPLHWGFIGETKEGFGPNSLTPFVGDANTDTPEFKAFLVDIKRIAGTRRCHCRRGRRCRGGRLFVLDLRHLGDRSRTDF
jgi:formate dehydrogenase major subunit